MDRITLIGLFVLFSVCSVMGQTNTQSTTNSLTIDGVTYQNPRFDRITSTTITIFHSTGIATVPLAKLPPELQRQFGYDPVKIAQENAARKEAKAKVDAAMRKIARPEVSEGLTPVSYGDGQFTNGVRNGVLCWVIPKQTSPNYFYWDVADDFLPPPGGAVDFELTYFDVGSGFIGLHYDSTDFQLPNAGAYKVHPSAIHRLNSGKWRVARFHVNDARFSNRENGGADFRFYNTGDDLMISAVQVLRLEPPSEATPSLERQQIVEFRIKAPDASKVYLAGEFIGWSETPLPMSRQANGEWILSIALKPGRYQYKFIVDDKWMPDPNNSERVDDGYNGFNSVIQILDSKGNP